MKRNGDTRLAPPLARRQASAPIQIMSDEWPRKWQRRAQWLRNHPFVVFMETAGLVGLIFAVALFVYELRERQDERVARMWQILTTPAPGNSGKIEALEYLNSEYLCLPYRMKLPIYGHCWKERISLTGIDMSRTSHRHSVYLQEVNLEDAILSGANFSGADLTGAKLPGARLFGTDFTGAYMQFADLQAADAYGAKFRRVDLRSANLSGTKFAYTELSSSNFQDVTLERLGHITNIWAWADRPPKNMPHEIEAAISYRDPVKRLDDK